MPFTAGHSLVNQTASAVVVMPTGAQLSPKGTSAIVPSIEIEPIFPALVSVNHNFPSGPVVILLTAEPWFSAYVCLGFPLASVFKRSKYRYPVIHKFPSLPAVKPLAREIM